jgi:hypothetical protein
MGDRSVVSRLDGSYLPGGPDVLDDNRGFYRVATVNPSSLVLEGDSNFAGDSISGDVTFGHWPAEFALYPTVHQGYLGAEGQNDLRVTSYHVGGSFKSDPRSVAPFTYRVLRPTPMVSQNTVDTVLMLRERFLSWFELLRGFFASGGTYFIFQRDQHASGLTLGVISNADAVSLQGLVLDTPFANSSSGLSLLDRRFWLLDRQLDNTSPPYTGFSTGEGRPVFLDMLEAVLGKEENLRELRSIWLEYRTNLLDGTKPAIRRDEDQKASRKETQEDLRHFRKPLV